VFCQPDGRPWNPDHVSKRFKRLARGAGVPVVKLHEGGRHTGNSMMYDAEVRQDITMRQVGHASREISQRYNHPMKQAHLTAAGRWPRWSARPGAGHDGHERSPYVPSGGSRQPRQPGRPACPRRSG